MRRLPSAATPYQERHAQAGHTRSWSNHKYKSAPQVPQPQKLKPTTWERHRSASRVPPAIHQERGQKVIVAEPGGGSRSAATAIGYSFSLIQAPLGATALVRPPSSRGRADPTGSSSYWDMANTPRPRLRSWRLRDPIAFRQRAAPIWALNSYLLFTLVLQLERTDARIVIHYESTTTLLVWHRP